MKYIILLISFGIFLAFSVFGYDNLTIHPSLTGAAVSLYNAQAERKITGEEMGWVAEGSIAEDADPRYLNHFFNPRTGRGLSDGSFSGVSAKAWSQNQKGAIGATGDYSENAILNNYRNGNYLRAFHGIGHMLHLVQDMSVPAHTRNDAHPKGDPYELWSRQNGKVNNAKASFVVLNSLEDAFNGLASFSHNNFFSEDTIKENFLRDLPHRMEKDINGENVIYIIFNNYRIIKVRKYLSYNQYMFDFRVNLDYWNMLSPKAVGYSAGVIDYFMKKFEEIDREKETKQLSLWEKAKKGIADEIKNNINGLKYAIGDAVIAGSVMAQNRFGMGRDTATEEWQDMKLFADEYKKATVGALSESANTIKTAGKKASAINIKLPVIGNPAKTEPAQAQVKKTEQVLGVKIFSSDGAEEDNTDGISGNKDQGLIPIKSGDNNPETGNDGSFTGIVRKNFLYTTGDITPPDTFIESSPVSISSSSSAYFKFFRTEPGSFEFNLDDNGWYESDEEQNIVNLADGGHTIKARAIDKGGNVDPAPAEYAWTVDATAPSVAIKNNPPRFASSSSAVFEFMADENDVTYLCELNDSVLENCETSTTVENLAEGENFFSIKAFDIAGNGSAKVSYDWLVDLYAPTSTMVNLASEYLFSGFAVYWSGSDSASSSGIKSYETEYRIENGEWREWIKNSSLTSSIFDKTIKNGESVSFRVRATDMAGNTGGWSAEASTKVENYTASHLVISEIQISGTTANDEFVELYNPTETAISLAGYKLKRKTSGGTEYNLVSDFGTLSVAAHSYLLITHPTGYDGAMTADINYSSNSYGLTADNTVILYDGAEIIDKTGIGMAGDYEAESYPENPVSGKSIERKSFSTSTSDTMQNSHIYSGNGYDAGNNKNDFVLKNQPDPQNSESPAEPSAPEIVVPSSVNDLTMKNSSNSSLEISWTAPFDSNIGSDAYYDLRYAEKNGSCNLQNLWASANTSKIQLGFAPGAVGTAESFEIKNLKPGTEYCIAIKTFNGRFLSSLSNQLSASTVCNQLSPFFIGTYEVRKDIASKITSPDTPDELILVVDFPDAIDRGGTATFHAPGSCSILTFPGWGNVFPSSRLIVEFVYNTSTKLFTGQHRSCTDNWGNPNKIENNKCKDGNFWMGKRWISNSDFVGTQEITVLNSSSYIPWQKP